MRKGRISLLLVMLLLSLLAGSSFAENTESASGSLIPDRSPETLRTLLEEADFYVQDGILYEFDTLKLASEGKLLTCFGNNAGSVYLILNLPPAPEQDAAEGNQDRG